VPLTVRTLALSAGAGVVRTSLLGLVPNGLKTEVEGVAHARMESTELSEDRPSVRQRTADRDGPYGHVLATISDSTGEPAG
jgi:hypothetical protein